MTFSNPTQHELFAESLDAFAAGDPHPLSALVPSGAVLETLSRILHRYSFMIPLLLRNLIVALLASPARETTFLRLEQALEPLQNDSVLTGGRSETISMFAAVFTLSGALSRRLTCNRTLARLLDEIPDPFAPRIEPSWYLDRFATNIDSAAAHSDRVAAIHIEQTVQLIRILARNAVSSADIAVINAELSALADATVEVCLRIAADSLTARGIAVRPPRTIAVMGLGKLGGRELNVSSDIDLIYLYDDSERGEADDLIEYFTRLGERLTLLLTEATELGSLYRVDTRLRADGASGPLVRSMRDYYRYLEMRGEAWERPV